MQIHVPVQAPSFTVVRAEEQGAERAARQDTSVFGEVGEVPVVGRLEIGDEEVGNEEETDESEHGCYEGPDEEQDAVLEARCPVRDHAGRHGRDADSLGAWSRIDNILM